jgi:hypothetical protein
VVTGYGESSGAVVPIVDVKSLTRIWANKRRKLVQTAGYVNHPHSVRTETGTHSKQVSSGLGSFAQNRGPAFIVRRALGSRFLLGRPDVGQAQEQIVS